MQHADWYDSEPVIAIAHRLSNIAAMDRLIAMDKGQFVRMVIGTIPSDRQGRPALNSNLCLD